MKKGKGFGPVGHGESEHEGRRVGGGEFAGMPHEVSMKAYPKAHEYGAGDIDDTMGTVDRSNMQAHGYSRKHVSNQH